MLFALEQITSKVCLKTMLNNNKIQILILIANFLRFGSLSPPCCRMCNIPSKELTFLKSFIDLLDKYTDTDKKDGCGHITADPPLIVCSEEVELPPDDCTHVVIPTTTTTENPCSVEQEEVDINPALCDDDTITKDPCFEEQPIVECEQPCDVEEQIIEELPCSDEEQPEQLCFDEDPCPEDEGNVPIDDCSVESAGPIQIIDPEVVVNPPICIYCEEDVVEGKPIVLPVEPDGGIGDTPCQHIDVDEPAEDACCETEEEDDEDDLCDCLPIIEISELFARQLEASSVCGCLSVKGCEMKRPILTVPWWAMCSTSCEC